MKGSSLVYNNSLILKEKFIDEILSKNFQETLPTCNIRETPEFYYIDIDYFLNNKHELQISYKHNFLILKCKLKNSINNFIFERIFFLENIDLNAILLCNHGSEIELIIKKIF